MAAILIAPAGSIKGLPSPLARLAEFAGRKAGVDVPFPGFPAISASRQACLREEAVAVRRKNERSRPGRLERP